MWTRKTRKFLTLSCGSWETNKPGHVRKTQEHRKMLLCEMNSAAAAAVVVILAAAAAAVAAAPAVPAAAEEDDDQDDDPERAVTTVAEHSFTLSPCFDFSNSPPPAREAAAHPLTCVGAISHRSCHHMRRIAPVLLPGKGKTESCRVLSPCRREAPLPMLRRQNGDQYVRRYR